MTGDKFRIKDYKELLPDLASFETRSALLGERFEFELYQGRCYYNSSYGGKNKTVARENADGPSYKQGPALVNLKEEWVERL